jgi:hypothetical protein
MGKLPFSELRDCYSSPYINVIGRRKIKHMLGSMNVVKKKLIQSLRRKPEQ